MGEDVEKPLSTRLAFDAEIDFDLDDFLLSALPTHGLFLLLHRGLFDGLDIGEFTRVGATRAFVAVVVRAGNGALLTPTAP